MSRKPKKAVKSSTMLMLIGHHELLQASVFEVAAMAGIISDLVEEARYGGGRDSTECLAIITGIARRLRFLSDDVMHRALQPDNAEDATPDCLWTVAYDRRA